MKRTLAGLGLLFVALGLGCGQAKEGDACQTQDPQCTDSHTALVCDTGAFRFITCPGPGGCAFDNTAATPTFNCDINGTLPGSNCLSADEGLVMCTAAHEALICNGTVWVDSSCPTQVCEDGSGDGTTLGNCE